MIAGWFDRDADCGIRNAAALIACLAVTVCAGPPVQTRWVKTGVDDATATREVNDCQAHANAVQNREQGINQDISATLGRNWAMSNTTRLQDQSMRQQSSGLADQAFNNCMRAKGFIQKG